MGDNGGETSHRAPVCGDTRAGRVAGVGAMAVTSLPRQLLTGITRFPLRVENGIFALRGKLVLGLAWRHRGLLRVCGRLCPRCCRSLPSLPWRGSPGICSVAKALGAVSGPVEEGERRDCVCPGPAETRPREGNHGGDPSAVPRETGKGAVRMGRIMDTDRYGLPAFR